MFLLTELELGYGSRSVIRLVLVSRSRSTRYPVNPVKRILLACATILWDIVSYPAKNNYALIAFMHRKYSCSVGAKGLDNGILGCRMRAYPKGSGQGRRAEREPDNGQCILAGCQSEDWQAARNGGIEVRLHRPPAAQVQRIPWQPTRSAVLLLRDVPHGPQVIRT